MISNPTQPDSLVDEESMEEGGLSNLSIGLIIGGIVCCCLIVALGICLFMKYRNDDSNCKIHSSN